MDDSKYYIILTTCNDALVKQKIINRLLEQKLASCIQVKEVDSHYIWEGKINVDQEYQLFIKTKSSSYQQVEQVIKQLHNYDIPEIIAVPITNGNSKYFEWIDGIVDK